MNIPKFKYKGTTCSNIILCNRRTCELNLLIYLISSNRINSWFESAWSKNVVVFVEQAHKTDIWNNQKIWESTITELYIPIATCSTFSIKLFKCYYSPNPLSNLITILKNRETWCISGHHYEGQIRKKGQISIGSIWLWEFLPPT